LIDRRQFIVRAGGFCSATLISSVLSVAAENSPTVVDFGPAKLDIYGTGFNALRPVLLYVHGGAWQTGSRKDIGAKRELCARLGYVLVSIDYRLFPFVKPGRQVDDVAAAFAWVRENISNFGGDPAQIVAMGHSAGAHLLALATLSGRLDGLNALICNDIFMYDIAKFAAARGGRLPLHFALVFGKASWKNLSPLTYLGQVPVPPVLVAYSSLEFSQDMSLDFAARLKSVGTDVSVFDGSAYKHSQINDDIGELNSPITRAIEAFLKDKLG
jgi:acetyl esterase/lipase